MAKKQDKEHEKTEIAASVVVKEEEEESAVEDVLSTEEIIKAEDEKQPPKEVTKLDAWEPRTSLGKKVKNREITDINYIIDNGLKILESEIVDILLPNLETDLLLIGQSKGKFGGGQRRVFRQTQKKTREGNKPKFSTIAIAGNKDGYVGIGYGKSKETVPAREKAFRSAKLNMIKIRRGNGSWQDSSDDAHTIPFTVEGKCGSVKIKLMPAPKGTGLCVEKECQKILQLAGIKNVRSKTQGQTKTKINLILACEKALKQLMKTKVQAYQYDIVKIKEGFIKVE